ncbi:hypothetical protein OUZ56_014549 [Daphnia magna]|uniref:Secreted protein n=1 Tax=Daphnia magna TaxID=35525 RepID=A0ABR0AK39_9CRUS|nr:hypothetical protein OUZ56_014549 [Daphnia magna]
MKLKQLMLTLWFTLVSHMLCAAYSYAFTPSPHFVLNYSSSFSAKLPSRQLRRPQWTARNYSIFFVPRLQNQSSSLQSCCILLPGPSCVAP